MSAIDNVVQMPVSPFTKVIDGKPTRLVPESNMTAKDERTPLVVFDGKTCPNCGWDISAHPTAPLGQ